MRLLIFGPGYAASRLIAALPAAAVMTVTRETFADRDRVHFDIRAATHILPSVPPGEDDPVLAAYAEPLGASAAWLGYLSSTGVYGDTGGAWVDEGAPIGGGRRSARAAADAAWLALGARVFRLPGIYGPGRSPLDRVRAIELAPDNMTYKYNLAIMLDKQGQYPDAVAMYRALIQASLRGEQVPASTESMQKRLNFLVTEVTSARTAAMNAMQQQQAR